MTIRTSGARSGRLARMRRPIRTVVLAALLTTAAAPSVGAPLAPTRPEFSATVTRIPKDTRAWMNGISWRPGCPVPLRALRLVRLRYWGFDREAHIGRLVVHRDVADKIVRVFRRLYGVSYPIRRMRLVDVYGADDRTSMAHDNTSAFNCRYRAGSPGVWSQHAYGRAIDVNPVENPYVWSGGVSPSQGAPYVDRSQHLRGMIHHRDAVWWAFRYRGWEWGGDWTDVKDYQHFSRNGR
jgi:D-alanyl-D-alanine carboxypeptidase-like protein